MPSHINLQISDPCHERWESMEVLSGAAFCQSCQKIVTDFTKMSDEQIVDYFKKYKGNTCGRFYADQINRTYTIPSRPLPWLKYLFTVTLPAIFLNLTSEAQKLTRQIHQIEVPVPGSKKDKDVTAGREISGTVINELGQPVPYATVMIANSNQGTATDSAGRFTLKINSAVKELQISSVGHEMKFIPVLLLTDSTSLKLSDQPDINLPPVIVVARLDRVVMGGAVMRYVRHKKRIPGLMPERVAAKPGFTIYPNPAPKRGFISLHFDEPVSGDQWVSVFDIEGKRMQETVVQLDQQTKEIRLALNLAVTGIYVVRITDQRSHKVQSARIMVQ